MSNFKEISEYPAGKRWMDRLKSKARGGREPSTLRIFPYYLFKFCTFAQKDPEQLITERLQDQKSDDMSVRRKHEELLTRWIGAMQEDNTSSNTIATSCGAVRSFYAANYIPITGVYVPSGVPIKTFRLPTPSELAQMLEAAEPRVKAWICCQKDSGISGGDLISLRLNNQSPICGTIKAQLMKNSIPVHVYLERGKGMSRGLGHYDSFFGKDAVSALRSFIDLNASPPDTKLFDFTEKTAELLIKAVSKQVMGEHITPHILRKFFNTYMKLAKVNESVIEYWMGHSLGKVKSAYFVPPVQEQMKLYMEAYPHIAIPR